MSVAGGEPRELVTPPPGYSFVEGLAWSPDGRRIAFAKRSQTGDEFSIESYDLNTGRNAVILADRKAGPFCWASDGRIVYARQEDPPNEKDSNLWGVGVDPQTAQARGTPRRLTNSGGVLFRSVSMSGDGRRIVAVGMRFRSDVLVADLRLNGVPFVTPASLHFGDRIAGLRGVGYAFNRPTGWTPGGEGVLLYSDRHGELDIFQQGVRAREAQALAVGPEEKIEPRLSPDRRWILYLAWPKQGERVQPGEGRLMRLAATGGTPQVVLSVVGYPGAVRLDPPEALPGRGHPRFRCPSVPGALCVLSEIVRGQVVFTAFDPERGRKTEISRIDVTGEDFWDLSPDGRWIALSEYQEQRGRIRLLPLAGQSPREISAGGWNLLKSVAWAANGEALFVTAFESKGEPLLRVTLDGKAELLYRGAKYLDSPVPSPDGRFLAFSDMTVESNTWLIENLR